MVLMSNAASASRHFAESVVQTLREAGHQAVFAGGCVRDLLLGQPAKDYDVATDARPAEIRNLFGKGRTLAVGESFGVVVVIPSRADRKRGIPSVEVATFRTDGDYRDGRHPENVEFATPEQDARRRDFTINGMFLDPSDGRVLDFVGGVDDLRERKIRAIGDPRARMREDKLRLLRAIRFTAALDFDLDPDTSAAVREMAGDLVIVSAERIAQELRRMLVHPSRARAVELCHDHGLLAVVIPELALVWDATKNHNAELWSITLRRLAELINPSFEVAMAALLAVLITSSPAEDGSTSLLESVPARLRLSNAESDRIAWLLRHFGRLDDFPRMTLAQAKRLAAHPGAAELLTLEEARIASLGRDRGAVAAFAEFLVETPSAIINPPPLLTGADLIKLGLKPGPSFGTLLEAVRDAQLNEQISNRDEALALVRELQNRPNAGTPMR